MPFETQKFKLFLQGSLSQAAQLLSGLSALAKLVETDELERRIAALERRHGGTQGAPT